MTAGYRCPACGRMAQRTVAYLRDRAIPERFCYCRSGHYWIVKGGARNVVQGR
jgi:hypothetical protein